MDAFAVSICKGLSMQKIDKKYTLCIGLFFGGFQALMPLTGYLLGNQFSGYIERFDHWIAFVLLALIGFNMIKESREEEEEEEKALRGRQLQGAADSRRRHEHRRAGRRRDVCFFTGEYCACHHDHRLHDVCDLDCGCVRRQCVRLALQEPRRAHRRRHSHFDRAQDLARAFGCDCVLIKREIISRAARECAKGGCSLSEEREQPPLHPPRERDEGPSPSTPLIAGL